MQKTNIEWVKNPPPPHIKVDANGRWHDPTGKFAEQPGYTWNPISGCLNGCNYCYARKLADTRLKEIYLANTHLVDGYPLAQGVLNDSAIPPKLDPFYPRFWEDKLLQPTDNQKPRGIFVCNMSDLFGIGIPEEWTGMVMLRIKRCPQHRFYLLTKQPQNLIKFSPFPANCFVGVSATNQRQFDEAVKYLKEVEATVKFISFEPLQEAMNGGECDGERLDGLVEAGISWAIIGAQTKPTVMPKIEWVLDITEAAEKAKIPVFWKDSLRPLMKEHFAGILRQEIPK